MKLTHRSGTIDLTTTAVMGVLNVTPDSFSDGGKWFDASRAVEHALRMVEEGAAIVDIGGESTRPGAEPVSEAEELRRVLPVIERVAATSPVPISIDTRKPAVARVAVDAGASIVNDTLGEEADYKMDEVAAATGAALVLMHSRGTPATMRSLNDYEDVVLDVRHFLSARAARAEEAGIAATSIAVDPGFGFAKAPAQNLEMLRRLDELVSLPFPLLAGTSRKSFIGAVLDVPEDQRVEGTCATMIWAVAKGARLVRAHDVLEVTRSVRMTEAILGIASS